MAQQLPWFRLYNEARTDRKLALLTDEEFRVWFNLLCYSSERSGRAMKIGGDHADDRVGLAIEVSNGDVDLLESVLSRLVTLRILRVEPELILFINGQSRQYDKPSDAPDSTAARKAKERDIKKPSHKVTPSHAVSPLEESRVDTEGEKKEKGPKHCPPKPAADEPEGFDQWWAAYPRKEAKFAARKAYRKALKNASAEAIMAGLVVYRFSPEAQFVPMPATWLNQGRWEDEGCAGSPRPAADPHDIDAAFENQTADVFKPPPPTLPPDWPMFTIPWSETIAEAERIGAFVSPKWREFAAEQEREALEG